jgi:MFS family permease
LREPPRRAIVANESASLLVPVTTGERFEGTIRDGFRAVRNIRTLRRTWVSAFLFGAGTIPLATVVSNFFHDVYHVNATGRGEIGALLGVFGLIGIVLGGLLSQRIIARHQPARFPIVSGLAVLEFGLFALVMAHVHSLRGSIIAACILAIGAVGFLPTYVTFVAVIAPPKLRSQAYAWSLFFYALGAICLSGVIGSVADSHGQRAALSLLAVLVMVGGLVGLSATRLVKGDLARLAET